MAGQGDYRQRWPAAAGRGATRAGMIAASRQCRITDFSCWPAAADGTLMAGLYTASSQTLLLPCRWCCSQTWLDVDASVLLFFISCGPH